MEEKRIYYVGIDHGNHLMKTSNTWFMMEHFIRLEKSVTV